MGGGRGGREGKEKEGMKTIRDISITDLKVGCACRKDSGYNLPNSYLFNFEHNIKNRVLWLFSDEFNKKMHCFLAQ